MTAAEVIECYGFDPWSKASVRPWESGSLRATGSTPPVIFATIGSYYVGEAGRHSLIYYVASVEAWLARDAEQRLAA